jgi:hypothetical protein
VDSVISAFESIFTKPAFRNFRIVGYSVVIGNWDETIPFRHDPSLTYTKLRSLLRVSAEVEPYHSLFIQRASPAFFWAEYLFFGQIELAYNELAFR